MMVKTSTLTGQALDWAVAKCEDKNGVLHDDGITRCIVIAAPSGVYKGRYTPTVNWAQGGPIIERERISIRPDVSTPNFRAFVIRPPEGLSHRYIGPTPLIAAMRCYVASKLGNQINVPEELL